MLNWLIWETIKLEHFLTDFSCRMSKKTNLNSDAKSAIVRRKERTEKGINNQLLLDSQTNERLKKDAKILLWLYYLKADPNAFPIEYNCSR